MKKETRNPSLPARLSLLSEVIYLRKLTLLNPKFLVMFLDEEGIIE